MLLGISPELIFFVFRGKGSLISSRKMDYTDVATTVFTPLEYGCATWTESDFAYLAVCGRACTRRVSLFGGGINVLNDVRCVGKKPPLLRSAHPHFLAGG